MNILLLIVVGWIRVEAADLETTTTTTLPPEKCTTTVVNIPFPSYDDADGKGRCFCSDTGIKLNKDQTHVPTKLELQPTQQESYANLWDHTNPLQYTWKSMCMYDGFSFSIIKEEYKIYFVGEEILEDQYVEDRTFCVVGTRDRFGSLDFIEELKNPIVLEDVGKICTPSPNLLQVYFKTRDEFMDHGEVQIGFDNWKPCMNIPLEKVGYKTCQGDAEYCDWYKEDTPIPCVYNTRRLESGMRSDGIQDWCTKYGGETREEWIANRRLSISDDPSMSCSKGQFCNRGGKINRCIPGNNVLATTFEAQLRKYGSPWASRYCIGKIAGAKPCKRNEICNPYASVYNLLCIPGEHQLNEKNLVAEFGESGISDDDAELEKYCIGNLPEEKCLMSQICSYASDGTVLSGENLCMDKSILLGTFNYGESWTHATQLRVRAEDNKYCLAKSSLEDTPYLSGICFLDKISWKTEVCNPHAKSLDDLCVREVHVMKHGERIYKRSSKPKKWVNFCIGDYFYNLNCENYTFEEHHCNHDARQEEDVCIPRNRLLNVENSLRAHRMQGDGSSWCFGLEKAAICKEDEMCNPNAQKKNGDHYDVCILAARVLRHGEDYEVENIYIKDICIGDRDSSTCHPSTVKNEYDAKRCDHYSGKCIDPKRQIIPGSYRNQTARPKEMYCFGRYGAALCRDSYYCNNFGTLLEVCIIDCTTRHVCLNPDMVMQKDIRMSPERNICLSFRDGYQASECHETPDNPEPFCDTRKGICIPLPETIMVQIDDTNLVALSQYKLPGIPESFDNFFDEHFGGGQHSSSFLWLYYFMLF